MAATPQQHSLGPVAPGSPPAALLAHGRAFLYWGRTLPPSTLPTLYTCFLGTRTEVVIADFRALRTSLS